MSRKKNVSQFTELFGAVIGVAFFLISPAALAQNLNKVVRFDIKPQTLDSALLEFGRQAHIQIMFASKIAAGQMHAKKLEGLFTSAHALAILLRGTGLTYSKHKNSIEVTPTRPRTNEAKTRAIKRAKRQSHATVRGVSDPPPPKSHKKESHETDLQQVIVTGSRLPTKAKFTPQEIQVYTKRQIDQSGQTSIADFLGTLPSVSVTPAGNAFGVGTTVALRGLPVGTTLVLLNGRRLEGSGLSYWSSGGNYFDLNNIPIAIVARIEIDNNGSSAIYGSDAIAGVVNIITKKHFQGFQVDTSYGWAKDTSVTRADIAWGKQWNKAGLEVITSYGIDGGLLNSDRQISSDNDYTALGGPNNNYPVCSPGNIFSSNGAPLPGAPPGSGATYAAVTGTTTVGKPPLSQFKFGALNTCSIIAGASLSPAAHRAGIYLQGHIDLSKETNIFTELMYTHLSQVQKLGYQSLFGIPGYQQFTASSLNPYNPFGTTVGVSEMLRQIPTAQIYSTEFFRPLIGIRGNPSKHWHWELSMWQSTDWSRDALPNLVPNVQAIQNGLDSPNPKIALNPFAAELSIPPSEVRSLFTNGDIKWMARDESVEGTLRGSLFRLPAGIVQLALGAQYVRSAFNINDINDGIDPPNTRMNFARSHFAEFGEARVPLIGSGGTVGNTRLLTLTLAARHDQYSDVGGTTTKQFGLVLRPVHGLIIRGTYADAFKAPPLPSLNSPDTSSTTVVVDPQTGNPVFVRLVTGGNPRLRPLKGHSHSVGVVYAPDAISGLTLSATQWQVVENNAIQALSPQALVNNEGSFPSRVVRNGAGVIDTVIATKINFGSIDAAGVDYEVSYHHSILRGQITTTLNAVETYHYLEALTPGMQPVEAVSVAQDTGNWTPRWKGMASITYVRGGLAIYCDGHYTGIYRDYDSTRQIGNFWIFNTNVRWKFGRILFSSDRWLAGAYAEIGARNAFNRAAQFSNYQFGFYGFDAAQTNVLGRFLYVRAGLNL